MNTLYTKITAIVVTSVVIGSLAIGSGNLLKSAPVILAANQKEAISSLILTPLKNRAKATYPNNPTGQDSVYITFLNAAQGLNAALGNDPEIKPLFDFIYADVSASANDKTTTAIMKFRELAVGSTSASSIVMTTTKGTTNTTGIASGITSSGTGRSVVTTQQIQDAIARNDTLFFQANATAVFAYTWQNPTLANTYENDVYLTERIQIALGIDGALARQLAQNGKWKEAIPEGVTLFSGGTMEIVNKLNADVASGLRSDRYAASTAANTTIAAAVKVERAYELTQYIAGIQKYLDGKNGGQSTYQFENNPETINARKLLSVLTTKKDDFVDSTRITKEEFGRIIKADPLKAGGTLANSITYIDSAKTKWFDISGLFSGADYAKSATSWVAQNIINRQQMLDQYEKFGISTTALLQNITQTDPYKWQEAIQNFEIANAANVTTMRKKLADDQMIEAKKEVAVNAVTRYPVAGSLTSADLIKMENNLNNAMLFDPSKANYLDFNYGLQLKGGQAGTAYYSLTDKTSTGSTYVYSRDDHGVIISTKVVAATTTGNSTTVCSVGTHSISGVCIDCASTNTVWNGMACVSATVVTPTVAEIQENTAAVPQNAQRGTTIETPVGNVITTVTQWSSQAPVGEVVNGTYYQSTTSTVPSAISNAYKNIGRATVDAGGAAYWTAQYNSCVSGGGTSCDQSITNQISASARAVGDANK